VTDATAQREHVQALYNGIVAWYEHAERKAQLILTLDGVFVSFLSASAFKKSADLRATTSHFGPETWVLLGLMAASLVVSIASAVVALRSRLYSRAELEHYLARHRVDTTTEATYGPAVTWFFQHLAELDPGVLAGVLRRADTDFVVRSLVASVVPLAQNVVRKHRWVNRGFFFAGMVLIFFLGAAVSYVWRISSS
jgi:hypothetical protein